jgi:hypothetical protein
MPLFFEALFVGLFLLPIYYLVEKIGYSKWITVFLAGALFHLVAEFSGLNKAYLLSHQS